MCEHAPLTYTIFIPAVYLKGAGRRFNDIKCMRISYRDACNYSTDNREHLNKNIIMSISIIYKSCEIRAKQKTK